MLHLWMREEVSLHAKKTKKSKKKMEKESIKRSNNSKQIIQLQLVIIFIDGNENTVRVIPSIELMENVTKIQNFYSNCQQFNTLSVFYLKEN